MIKTTSPKNSKKQLKLDRETQIAQKWHDYHTKRNELVSTVSANERKLEGDGFYLYTVSVWFVGGNFKHFDYYSKFDQENKAI